MYREELQTVTGAEVRRLRKRWQMTQAQFGKLFGYTTDGSAIRHISDIEREQESPTLAFRILFLIYYEQGIPEGLPEAINSYLQEGVVS